MRIAQVAPLYEAVPPKTYGGTERIVHYLTEALVDLGHEVTLFASGDSITRAKLISNLPSSLRLSNRMDPLIYHYIMLEEVYRRSDDFDVIHFHVDYLHFPRTRALHLPNLTTLHGKLTIADLEHIYREFPEMPVVSISDHQRKPLPWLNWQGTVYHGLPVTLYKPCYKPNAYLAFLGRISPEKGLDKAIQIARLAGYPLKIAAKVDKADMDYFISVIQPLFQKYPETVEFIGEINDAQKQEFLSNAHALLFPIAWPEPFGLVMIEAMACATPVIAFGEGSVPEIIQSGVNGFISHSVERAVSDIRRLNQINRQDCRRIFEARFTSNRMARNYLAIYSRFQSRSRGSIGRLRVS